MHHYIDIHLRPDPEFPAHQLMAALCAKLHRGLVQVRTNRIAVSFPGYREAGPTIGSTLRLIGPAAELGQLMEEDWLRGMRDHVDVKSPSAVPDGVPHRSLRRVQAKSSPTRLRRRQMRRHRLTEEEALERAPDTCAEVLNLPFLAFTSTSTGQRFKLFLRLGPSVTIPQPGDFNSYGLSSTATIPWF